ncbi:hypothetical protein QYF36_012643 [Acer negundo]|nr:hypothetical protein QYF36_012643 [Acer negundo]
MRRVHQPPIVMEKGKSVILGFLIKLMFFGDLVIPICTPNEVENEDLVLDLNSRVITFVDSSMNEEDVDDKRSGANASAPLSEAQDELVMGEVERQREMPLLAIPIQNSAILLLMTLMRLVLKLLTILPGSCRGKTSSVEGVTHSFDPQSIAVGPSEVPSLSGRSFVPH